MEKDFSQKNNKIKAAMIATYERREWQACKVFTLKIDAKKLTQVQKETLKMMFVEGKWLRNAVLAWSKESEDNNPWDYEKSHDLKTAIVRTKDGSFETRALEKLGMQMRQSVVAEVVSNIRGLAALKKKGHKVGALKFVREMRSLNLKQYGMSHKFKSERRMKLQNVPGTVYVLGTKQIPKGCEIANAKLLNKADGYYIALTVFIDKNNISDDYDIPGKIGIDMGRQTSITTSEGTEINVQIEEPERLKRLQRKLARQKKGSNNWRKTKRLIAIEYQKITNKRNDAGNKIVHELLKHEQINMQDEQLHSWHNRKVQNSCLGRVKAKLIVHPRVVVLSRWAPTTKRCTCGHKQQMHLWDRTFICDVCGHTEGRDIHAAKNMIFLEDEFKIGVGRTNSKPVENALDDAGQRALQSCVL